MLKNLLALAPTTIRCHFVARIKVTESHIIVTKIVNPPDIVQFQPSPLSLPSTDLITQLLEDKRSPHTRLAYMKDLRDFYRYVYNATEPTPELIQDFLSQDRFMALSVVLKYKAHLRDERGLAEATINRRLAAIKSLVRFAYQLGKCNFTLSEVKGDKVVRYRDTTGVSKEVFRKMLAVPDLDTLKGKRDYAILRLLWDNVLRRGEISQANIKDLDLDSRFLLILGKGKGKQKEAVSLSRPTVTAIMNWLHERREIGRNKPLFIALDRCSYGHRLSTTSIYNIVNKIATDAGISKKLSPHRIRHSGITAALDATNGDVRGVQKLSRHADLNTLIIYDDNRKNVQGEISDILSELV